MENGAGEDLGWFWKGWFYNNYSLDLALVNARYVNNDPKQGIQVTVANKDAMAMPFAIEVKLRDGSKKRMQLPVETWQQDKAITFVIPTTTAAESVTVDPDAALPDINRKNNTITIK